MSIYYKAGSDILYVKHKKIERYTILKFKR